MSSATPGVGVTAADHERLVAAIAELHESLKNAATASDRASRRLICLTWVLVLLTVVIAALTVVIVVTE